MSLTTTSLPALVKPKPYRTEFLDEDNRREPKTDFFCAKCHKDLKPDQPHRIVHLVDGGHRVLHPGDESAYVPDRGDCGCFYLGMDCARKLGLEWSSPK